MTRAFLVLLVTAVAAAGIWIESRTPAGLLPSPRRPYQSYGSPRVRTERPAYPRYATGADDVRVRIDRPARRIVSQHAHADEYLYAVVPAERIVGVSETAYDRRFSNVFEYAARYHPIVASDPERVLLANPDLVITAEASRAEVPDLLRQAGVPVYRMYTMFETLASIEEHVRLILFTAAILTGASVAVAGLIGFVGLIVPHAVRLILGPRHRTLLPAAAIAGAAFLIACDIAARTARPPAEIRLGVVTALCGAPIFLAILLKRLRRGAP